MLKQAEEHIKKALKEGLKGANRECKYYPCHFPGQDCTFCFCPFYPCYDYRLGRMIISSRGNRVWSCKYCGWIHQPETARRVLESLRKAEMERRELSSIFRRLRNG